MNLTCLIFLFFLNNFVLPASIGKCKPADEKCTESFNQINERIIAQHLTQEEGMKEFHENCKVIQKCSSSLKCDATEDRIEVLDGFNAFCEASIFRHSSSFIACDAKLANINSTCINEWDPYPELGEDPEENEKIMKKFCSEFFGKENCLEKKMTDVCSVEIWNEFKKNQLAMNKISGACDFD